MEEIGSGILGKIPFLLNRNFQKKIDQCGQLIQHIHDIKLIHLVENPDNYLNVQLEKKEETI